MVLFFFNDTATTEIYTLSLHDALPICKDWDITGAIFQSLFTEDCGSGLCWRSFWWAAPCPIPELRAGSGGACARVIQFSDRKSTRLNSSHANISYAVFCLKKKNQKFTR